MIRQLRAAEERTLRLRLLPLDADLALHRQLKDYFLADSDLFGVWSWEEMRTLCFFSRFNGKTYIHYIVGDPAGDLDLLNHVEGPCEVFVTDGRPEPPVTAGWRHELSVTRGMMIDHRCYDGVFWRTAPRFAGKVFARD
jgi:hypothetical protein